MSRIAYVNGRYLPHQAAQIHIDDRGYQFGDGIYEVVSVIDGRFADLDWHLDRMDYSLDALKIPAPMSRQALKMIIRNIARMNRLRYGFVYFQTTRGVMARDHAIDLTLSPQLVMTAKSVARLKLLEIESVDVITVPDQRWLRRDIKTLQLLPNCLAKTAASDQDAYEAWMVDANGFITEGSSSNAWIVTKGGELITRPATYDILSGITRKAVFEIASSRNLKIVERAFTPQEALEASEAFLTSATSIITSVGRLDGQNIGDGKGGPVAGAMRLAYFDRVAAVC